MLAAAFGAAAEWTVADERATDLTVEVDWPELNYADWRATLETLHMWTQIVGKCRLVQSPWVNHSWHVPLYVTPRGLTTTAVPYGQRTFQIDFDFVAHALVIQSSDGRTTSLALAPRTVADFYRELIDALAQLGFRLTINTTPNEVVDPIPFDQDRVHATYDAAQATRFWQALVHADRVMKAFRAGFVGKCSPVHFFWGSFDLAVTRFSGRRAPEHPGGVPNLPDWVVREAYSHEVSSCGFWPGSAQMPQAIFYSYAYPEPSGFRTAPVRPDAATFSGELGEFVLPYDAVRQAASPDATLLEFLESTYEAAATLGQWDRGELERPRAR